MLVVFFCASFASCLRWWLCVACCCYGCVVVRCGLSLLLGVVVGVIVYVFVACCVVCCVCLLLVLALVLLVC